MGVRDTGLSLSFPLPRLQHGSEKTWLACNPTLSSRSSSVTSEASPRPWWRVVVWSPATPLESDPPSQAPAWLCAFSYAKTQAPLWRPWFPVCSLSTYCLKNNTFSTMSLFATVLYWSLLSKASFLPGFLTRYLLPLYLTGPSCPPQPLLSTVCLPKKGARGFGSWPLLLYLVFYTSD